MRASIIFILFITTFACKAQTDSIKVLDLTVMKSIVNDYAYNTDSSIVTHCDSIHWKIQFKVTNKDSLSELFIEIGSTKEGHEICNLNLSHIKQNGQDYLIENGNTICQFSSGTISFVKLTRYITSQNANWLNVKAKHINGNFSEKSYFKIK